MKKIIFTFKFIRPYIIKFKLLFFIILTFTVMTSLINLAMPKLFQHILDNGVIASNKKNVVILGSIILALYILNSIISYFSNILYNKISINFIASLKKDVCQHVLSLPITFFDENQTGYLISRLDEIDSISIIFSSVIFNFITSTLTTIGAIIVLINKSVPLLLATLAFGIPFYLISRYSMSAISNHSLEIMEMQAKTNGQLQESFQGIFDIKQTNAEEKNSQSISDLISATAKKLFVRSKLSSLGSEGIILVLNLASTVLTILVAIYIINGSLSIGSFVSLTKYSMLIYAPIQQLSVFSITIQPGIVALERVNSILNIDCEKSISNSSVEEINSIRLVDLSFKYNFTDSIINNVNLTLNCGDNIVITGPNGSGKSTLAKLILGFYDSYAGSIFINDKELRTLNKKSLRNKISIVSQKIFLFSGTIEENIKLGDSNISDSDLNSLCDIFKDNLFESEFRNSFKIIDGGKNLSGGQIQKIAIARAILRKPDIIIFDEASSNIDSVAKEFLNSIISTVFEEKICIIITHDASIINSTLNNKVFRIEDKRLVQL
ncbi:ABC transporter ATP-binding protein [Clostridium sp. C8-1-8]|uniref:ABC transporter ATP-binding protein n=1 Tax=Clostridium sp. C8-1-8 TaxID=2698831 RepID=UPI00136D9B0E|nr:ABC transporter ATP-binding protein [Clostridium sp. C8-1-8]